MTKQEIRFANSAKGCGNQKKGAAEFTGPMSLLKDSLSRARKVNQFTKKA